PVLPNYLLSMSETKVIVRNYEGFITAYAQPRDYKSHDPETCPYCRQRHSEAGQEGVAGLLAGQAREITPEGWRATHERLPQRRSTAPFIVKRGPEDLQLIQEAVNAMVEER
ncbi:MAG: hypothetical protein JXB35_01575, partial [Anaerolineae bacterium]|nr:hypothetical protein [Anaerolineae bacterium]